MKCTLLTYTTSGGKIYKYSTCHMLSNIYTLIPALPHFWPKEKCLHVLWNGPYTVYEVCVLSNYDILSIIGQLTYILCTYTVLVISH
jgi:hypothetical protein